MTIKNKVAKAYEKIDNRYKSYTLGRDIKLLAKKCADAREYGNYEESERQVKYYREVLASARFAKGLLDLEYSFMN